ncbi:MAG: hypothetical protein ABI970_20275, partial [Chloroflexota bacterium]
MMEAISSSLDTNQIVESIAYGALRLIPFNQMNVALADAETGTYDLLKITINNDSSLVTTREHRPHIEGTALMKAVTDNQDSLYLAGDPTIADYMDLQTWHAQGEKTSLIIPLMTGGKALGAMHIGSDQTDTSAFDEFRPLLKRISNLAAVSIQNAHLFNQALNLQNFNESIV